MSDTRTQPPFPTADPEAAARRLSGTRRPRITTMWTSRAEAQVTVEGLADAALAERLDTVLEGLVDSGARHLSVELNRLGGDERAVLDVLAGACRRLWRRRGVMELHTVRRPSSGRPEVRELPATTMSSSAA